MENKNPIIDLSALDQMYRLTRLAINADDEEKKGGMIELAEEEADEFLEEAHRAFEAAFGDEWRERIGVLTAVLCAISLGKSQEEFGLEFMDAMSEEHATKFYMTTRIISQVSFVAGFALALKSAGLWEKFKATLGDKDG